jgi:hypothetical protein
LAQKALGFRYLMDVVPLDPHCVRGSHGLSPGHDDQPLLVGEDPPESMLGFKDYVQALLRS